VAARAFGSAPPAGGGFILDPYRAPRQREPVLRNFEKEKPFSQVTQARPRVPLSAASFDAHTRHMDRFRAATAPRGLVP